MSFKVTRLFLTLNSGYIYRSGSKEQDHDYKCLKQASPAG